MCVIGQQIGRVGHRLATRLGRITAPRRGAREESRQGGARAATSMKSGQTIRKRWFPGRNGDEATCPSKRRPHRPGMAVPQSGHVPSEAIR